jgi:hypothetical protein
MALSYAVANLDKVHLVEAIVATWSLNVEDRNNVLMVEVPQKLHFSQGS